MNVDLSRMIRKVHTHKRTAVDSRALATLIIDALDSQGLVVLVMTSDAVVRFSKGKEKNPNVAYNTVSQDDAKLYEKVMVRDNAKALMHTIVNALGVEYCNSSYNMMMHELSGNQIKRSKSLFLEGGNGQDLSSLKIVENYFLDGVEA